MKKIQVVIGANYGDEGKGRITAELAGKSKNSVAVVRFNGGAQAGHTVKNGSFRHVFSHFGSGSFDYVPTILTSDFVCSPYLFKKENEQLVRKSVIRPDMYVSPECLVTTPWDMIINQLSELSKGAGRHGSVGVGFGETIERSINTEFKIAVNDLLLNKEDFLVKMNYIFAKYAINRLNSLGTDFSQHNGQNTDLAWMIHNPSTVNEMFYQECQYFIDRVNIVDESEALNKFDHLIFEGAQGLALDQESPDFPHVTRSFTGIDNVLKVLGTAGIQHPLELIYVTRPYFTRHGAGPLKNEVSDLKYFNVVDHTNKPHDFQGSLRFTHFNLNDILLRIKKDISKVPSHLISKIIGAITCLDQVSTNDKRFLVVQNERIQLVDAENFIYLFAEAIAADEMLVSFSEDPWGISHFNTGYGVDEFD